MKTYLINKWEGNILIIFFSVIITFSTGCTNHPNQAENERIKELSDIQDSTSGKKADEKDSAFLEDMAAITVKGVQIGTLASIKGNNKDVCDLGKRMANDFAKANNEFVALAAKKNIAVQGDANTKLLKAFQYPSSENGMTYDKRYCEKMEETEKEAIDKLENAAKKSSDGDVMILAISWLSAFRSYLDEAKSCEKILADQDKENERHKSK